MPETVTSQPPEVRPPQQTMSVEARAERKLELMAKVKQIHINAITQGGRIVKGDPDKKYTWVRNNADRQLTFKTLGWVRCFSPKPESLPQTDHRTEEGLHIRGDLILYEMPLDFFEASEALKELRRINVVEDSENSFSDAAARHGVKTYKPKR